MDILQTFGYALFTDLLLITLHSKILVQIVQDIISFKIIT